MIPKFIFCLSWLLPHLVPISLPEQPAQAEVGVTVITHGFSPGGLLSKEWKNFALAIRERAGIGSIYINDPNTGKWEALDRRNSNNPSHEVIFLYNWAWASDNSKEGYLEACADHLMAMLLSPPPELGIKDRLALVKKPLHLIGHSRGGMLMNILAHKMGFFLASEGVQIEQLTLLDAHPAIPMGDCDLPGVYGEYPPTKDYSSEDCYLKIPSNVVRADNYYRKDGVYEDFITEKVFGPYDGLSVKGLGEFNRELNNVTLSTGATKLGGAHASIATRWYFGTIDLKNSYEHPINLDWYRDDQKYKAMGPREKTGYYHSRLGGGELPPKVPEDATIPPARIENAIYNGNFDVKRKVWKAQIPGWDKNGGGGGGRVVQDKNSNNTFLRLELNKIHIGKRDNDPDHRIHSFFYVPKDISGKDFGLSFTYRQWNVVDGKNEILISFEKIDSDGSLSEWALGEPIILRYNGQKFDNAFIPWPEKLKHQVGRLRIRLSGQKNNCTVDIDNVALIPNPN